ncbi:MAG: hypothetical protein C7B43_03595 [Sulfobacillus benefaciens]|uniref:Uncharacterized protein n=1 Tax=Sulfobacillus benefaciens TaxID=453960 RepID=A0A2T2X9K4_9FIRM|nr:MAG: hypothetical protein C7B43_03595 [Sulfobacillus benefaciens]
MSTKSHPASPPAPFAKTKKWLGRLIEVAENALYQEGEKFRLLQKTATTEQYRRVYEHYRQDDFWGPPTSKSRPLACAMAY